MIWIGVAAVILIALLVREWGRDWGEWNRWYGD